jgi:hypothetical protein
MTRIPSVRTRTWPIVLLSVAPRAAVAAGPLGNDGDPIATSNYGVDLTQTPVVAGARVTGLAGAYVAIAEGVDGNVQTPVAPAVRAPHSVDHFDYDLGLGLLVPATLTSTDFFNTGHGNTKLSNSEQQGFVFVTPAVNLAWGGFALGATLEFQTYALRRGASTQANARADKFDADFSVAHLQAAQTFGGGDFVLGAGARLVNLDVRNPAAPPGQTELFVSRGVGAELGALWKPVGQPFRIGAAFRSGVTTDPDAQSQLTPNPEGDRILGDINDPDRFYLPNRMQIPWDVNVGLALQIGPRPLNPRWKDPAEHNDRARATLLRRSLDRKFRHDAALRDPGVATSPAAREALDADLDTGDAMDELHLERVEDEHRRSLKDAFARMPRRYVLVSMSLVVTGQTNDTVGVESFLQRVVARSGERLGFSPRLGVETEFIPNWARARIGTYGEPTRFVSSSNRLHGTIGFDVKLFPWSIFGLFEDGTHWRLSAALDVAPRYLGWGVGIGVWH